MNWINCLNCTIANTISFACRIPVLSDHLFTQPPTMLSTGRHAQYLSLCSWLNPVNRCLSCPPLTVAWKANMHFANSPAQSLYRDIPSPQYNWYLSSTKITHNLSWHIEFIANSVSILVRRVIYEPLAKRMHVHELLLLAKEWLTGWEDKQKTDEPTQHVTISEGERKRNFFWQWPATSSCSFVSHST